MRWICHLPDQIPVQSCLQVNPLFLQLFCLLVTAAAVTYKGLIFQPLTKNRHGFESHGSGVLFKPTRGPFVTKEFGTFIPASIHKPPVGSVKSTSFSLLVIPIACVNFPGPNVSRPFLRMDIIS